MSARAISSRTAAWLRVPRNRTASPRPCARAAASRSLRSGPSPTTRSVAGSRAGPDAVYGGEQDVDALARHEASYEEQRGRASGSRAPVERKRRETHSGRDQVHVALIAQVSQLRFEKARDDGHSVSAREQRRVELGPGRILGDHGEVGTVEGGEERQGQLLGRQHAVRGGPAEMGMEEAGGHAA